MFDKFVKEFMYGDKKVVFETGEIARQASGAVKVSMGDTVVLVTVVGDRNVKEGQDFFPLTVDYYERAYAGGKIPGGFIKREGKPSEKEILTARLIDRPIRPLFPSSFYHDIQVVATVLSLDPEIDSDIPALLGASCAMVLSGVPFMGPIGAARVGYVDGQYVLNPTRTQLAESDLDLVVAGTDDAVLMVESEAKELSEEVMLGAVTFGHENLRVVVKAINELADEIDPVVWDWDEGPADEARLARIREIAWDGLQEAFRITSKQEREEKLSEVWGMVESELVDDSTGTLEYNGIRSAFKDLEKLIVRGQILEGKPRIDGRDLRTVRPISITTGLLPRAHGSALFTRGETQALAVSTLGTAKDMQTIDNIGGEYQDRFIFHYNFPPYSTGEIGRIGIPKRREIGHGRLAKRGLLAVLPDPDEFNYTIRVVSEICESNGSSSMASVCAGCLSMLSAGIPLKDHVAGIAMGLILEGDRYAILTDILGDEDHLGDMDFKVAGTVNGVTALQMDIKIRGIDEKIMKEALEQAKEGRLHILGLMKDAVGGHGELSQYAPRLFTMQIRPEKIREVIGKGGETIRAIVAETNTQIDIDDNGKIVIAAVKQEDADKAIAKIESITLDAEIGQVYPGTVLKLIDNNVGAIVGFMNNKDGMVHVSEIANERVKNVKDYLSVGDQVKVKVISMDPKGRFKLSIKQVDGGSQMTGKGPKED